jgi:hypothetical protein
MTTFTFDYQHVNFISMQNYFDYPRAREAGFVLMRELNRSLMKEKLK